MKYLIALLILLKIVPLNAQSSIKKIIYEDLIALNSAYNYALFDTQQNIIFINDLDTQRQQIRWNEIVLDFENNVTLVSVDSIGGFFLLKHNLKKYHPHALTFLMGTLLITFSTEIMENI